MKVAIYARVSTSDQTTDLQLDSLREFSKARGFTIIGEYVDEGVSGATESRPALNKLMEEARKRKFDAVLVWKFDRFARSTRHLLSALDQFRCLGIEFLSYSENLDTSSAMGKAVFTIVAAVAELERNLIRERVIAGQRSARARGKKWGGRRRAILDGNRILALRNSGHSTREVAIEISRITGRKVSHVTIASRLKELDK